MSNYDLEKMRPEDIALLNEYSRQWNKAYAAGDQQGMNRWHAEAEKLRGEYGYSGGANGAQYTAIPGFTPRQTISEMNIADSDSRSAAYQRQLAYSGGRNRNPKGMIPVSSVGTDSYLQELHADARNGATIHDVYDKIEMWRQQGKITQAGANYLAGRFGF